MVLLEKADKLCLSQRAKSDDGLSNQLLVLGSISQKSHQDGNALVGHLKIEIGDRGTSSSPYFPILILQSLKENFLDFLADLERG